MRRVVGSLVLLAVVVLVLLLPLVLVGSGNDAQTTTDVARIDDYSAQFQVDRDGTLAATERLVVDFPVPKHGIFRFFDTFDAADDHVRLSPHDVEVTRDGHAEPTERSHQYGGRYYVLKIGDKDITMTGQHTYVIRYRIDGALAAGSSSGSQFFWNLIPSGWQMAIARSELTAQLPAAPTSTQCAVGVGASSGCTAEVSGSTLTVRTGALEPHQPVTIRSNVDVPPPGQTRTPWPNRYDVVLGTSPVFLGVLVVLALLAAGAGFVLARRSDEEDPAFPLMYAPPDGIGPAQGAYLLTERVNDDAYAATMLQLGEKGVATLTRDDDGWTIDGIRGDWNAVDEVTAETAGALGIQGEGSRFTVHKDDVEAGQQMQQARKGFDGAVLGWAQNAGLMVRRGNLQMYGLLVVACAVVVVACAIFNPFDASMVGLPFGAFAAFAVPLLRTGASTFRTATGRDVWSKVGGFRRVLGTDSSEARFDFSGRKELYTQYIPWAVAFGVADVWAQKYRVAMQAEPPTPSYFLGGYYAGSMAGFSGSDFTADFNSSVQSSISSYQATQSSSSGGGFGGGGFGGGGGGGGGGGSW